MTKAMKPGERYTKYQAKKKGRKIIKPKVALQQLPPKKKVAVKGLI